MNKTKTLPNVELNHFTHNWLSRGKSVWAYWYLLMCPKLSVHGSDRNWFQLPRAARLTGSLSQESCPLLCSASLLPASLCLTAPLLQSYCSILCFLCSVAYKNSHACRAVEALLSQDFLLKEKLDNNLEGLLFLLFLGKSTEIPGEHKSLSDIKSFQLSPK